jgi:hypothetical protein
VYTRGAADVWAVCFFSTTYFDEMIIFGGRKWEISMGPHFLECLGPK